jgi:hypothetical protein
LADHEQPGRRQQLHECGYFIRVKTLKDADMRFARLLSILLLVQMGAAAHQSDTDTTGPTDMTYTIEVRAPSEGQTECKIIAQFTGSAWNSLWQELGVGEQEWLDWQNAVQTAQQDIPVLPDFPQISKLAYIDEGTVHFQARELHEECVRMSSLLGGEATQQIIRSLLEASDSALQNNDADVVVHPYPA